MTTSGLDKFFIQNPNLINEEENAVKLSKSKLPSGLVSKFGPDVPIDIKFDLDSVHNLRISKGKETMKINAHINIEFWVNNGTSVEVLDLSIKNCVIYFQVNSTKTSSGMSLYTQIVKLDFGDIGIDFSALGSELGAANKNFGLNLAPIEQYLIKIKPLTILSLNSFLITQQFTLPTSLFFEVFNFDFKKVNF